MANEVEKIDFGTGEVFEIPKPNNAEIVIKQGGVEKGRFTVNASEPVEINLDSGKVNATDTNEKIYLVGATSQSENAETFSNHRAYIENGGLHAGSLYSDSLIRVKTPNAKGTYLLYGTVPPDNEEHTYSPFLPAKSGTIAMLDDMPTKSSLGLGNVENKSSATIRGELTTANVTDALGYTPLKDHQDISGKANAKPSVSGTMNDVAAYGNAMGMINLSGTDKNINPDGQTGWHHFLNMSYNTESNNMWQTQLAVKAGTTDVYVRSRDGSAVSSAAWKAPWARLAKTSDIPTSLPANGGTSASCSGNSATATTAAKLARNGNTSYPMTFNWSGQSGQPSWLWGGSDGTNMYVYNPSNFSVNYAKSAGSVAWGNVSSKPSGIACLRSNAYTGSADSLSSVESTGVYRMSNGSSNPNAILVVFSPVDTCVAQLLFAYDGTTYSRVKWYTNAWTAWKKLTP